MKTTGLITCIIISIICFMMICCCLLIVTLAGSGLDENTVILNQAKISLSTLFEKTPTPLPSFVDDDFQFADAKLNNLQKNLSILEQTIVPTADLRDLSYRFEGKKDIPHSQDSPAYIPKLGDEKQFWVTNMDNDKSFQVTATLQEIGDNTYFWVENKVKYDKNELKKLVKAFDKKIYKTNREFFGEEFSPGIDGDTRLYMLLAKGLGNSVAAYFSSVDSYSSIAHEYSNEHEMFILNADNIDLGEEFTYGVLAHEFQHMIHWHQDRNEDTWLNEGFAELASFINGYGAGGFDHAFVANPDMQLTYWPGGDADTTPYYGAAFLFTNYFLGRFGEKATQALVGHPANGMVSVDEVLQEMGAVNPANGKTLSADDVFLDWTIATFLNNPHIEDGKFAYKEYQKPPKTRVTETIDKCPTNEEIRDVHQYGVDLIELTCRGNYQFRFSGSQVVKVLPMHMPSGYYAFWSNRGDESNMTLTKSFDFSHISGEIMLKYSLWYDLEKNYDYVYLLASLDGKRWEIIKTPSGTDEDPSGNSYGWAYNDVSGGGPQWIEEKVDLTKYAGKKVQIRFEYVTDAAVNGEGLLVDNITIPAINYFTDFEEDNGGWEAAGFVRIQNNLPQKFRLAYISMEKEPKIQYLSLDERNTITIPLNLKEDGVFVVTGVTRYTNQKATYRIQVIESP